jgi:hypothetical protein
MGGRRYSSYSFFTSALDGGERSASRPSHTLARGKDPRYPLYRRLGGPQPLWTQRLKEKSFCLCRGLNLDLPVVQSVLTHYTDSYSGCEENNSHTRIKRKIFQTAKKQVFFCDHCVSFDLFAQFLQLAAFLLCIGYFGKNRFCLTLRQHFVSCVLCHKFWK